MLCPLCGEGTVTPVQRARPMEHKNQTGVIHLHLSSCDRCGAETIDDAESILNRRAVIRFRKQIDGVPLGSQIRTMRKAANITQEQAGRLFGGGPVAFSKYENDDLIPDEAMTNLLRLAISDISIVDKLQALKAGGTTTAIQLMPHADIVAKPSSAWVCNNGFDDEDIGEFVNEVTHSRSEILSDHSGDKRSWRLLN